MSDPETNDDAIRSLENDVSKLKTNTSNLEVKIEQKVSKVWCETLHIAIQSELNKYKKSLQDIIRALMITEFGISQSYGKELLENLDSKKEDKFLWDKGIRCGNCIHYQCDEYDGDQCENDNDMMALKCNEFKSWYDEIQKLINDFIKAWDFKIEKIGIIQKGSTIMNLRLYKNEIINQYKKMLK